MKSWGSEGDPAVVPIELENLVSAPPERTPALDSYMSLQVHHIWVYDDI